MDIIVKKMETDEEKRGKAYVHWKSWQEAYPAMVSQISKGGGDDTKHGGRLFGGGLFCHLKRSFAESMPDSRFHGV